MSGDYKEEYGDLMFTLASYSSCSIEKITAGTCCTNNLPKTYKLEYSKKLNLDNYIYTILSNTDRQHIVISFASGTIMNFRKQGYLDQPTQFKDQKYGMFVANYLSLLYNEMKDSLVTSLKAVYKKYPNYQYIFTGHGIGAGIATMASLDAALSKNESIINTYANVTDKLSTSPSPVLLNFGSPRVGNFIFASYVMRYVPVVYRILRAGDMIAITPPCTFLFKCSNQLKLTSFSDDSAAFKLNPAVDKVYWHIAGLIQYNSSMTKFTNCGKTTSENLTGDCKYDPVSLDNSRATSVIEFYSQKFTKICS